MSDLRKEELILGAMAEVFEDLADKSKKSLKAYIDKNHDDATAVRVWDEYQKPSRTMLTTLVYDYTRDPGARQLTNDLARMAAHFATKGGSSC